MEIRAKGRGAASVRCWFCQLREQSLCTDLEIQGLDLVGPYKTVRTVRAGMDLFGQGEPCDEVYNLHHGWAFTYLILEDGRRQILSFGLSNGIYGLFPEQVTTMPFGCQALSDVTVCAVPRRQFLRLIQENPALGLQLAWDSKRDEMVLYEHLTSIGRRSARERVAYLLLELFCRSEQRLPQGRGEAIALPLNQAHIADAMGLTSIHVSRTLKGLREDGILQLKDGLLEILDPEQLFEAAVIDVEGVDQWVINIGAAAESSEPAQTWMPARLPSAIRSRVMPGSPIRVRPSANSNTHTTARR